MTTTIASVVNGLATTFAYPVGSNRLAAISGAMAASYGCAANGSASDGLAVCS